MSAVKYVGDDGTTYQVEQPNAYSAPTAGDLSPAVGTEPLYPALWIPRHLLAYRTNQPCAPRVSIVCNAVNPRFISGVGTTFSISGIGYTVEACIGEVRPPI